MTLDIGRGIVRKDGLFDWYWEVPVCGRTASGRTFLYRTAVRRMVFWQAVAARAAE